MSKLPREWKELSLEDICIPKGIRRGPFGGALKKDIFVPNGYKVYEQKNAISKDLSLGQYFITEEKYNEMEAFQVKENDFLISCSGTIGKIVQIPNNYKQGIINQALLKLTLNNFVINDTFFKYQFESDKIQSLIVDNTQGGAMPNLVGMSIFKNTKFIIPPLEEQKKIADILSTVDKKIVFVEENINATEELKKGLMQKLLTEGIGHTEFKDSGLSIVYELKKIPQDWNLEKLNFLANKITDGAHFTPTYVSEGIPFLRVTDLKSKDILNSDIKFIPESEHIELIKRCKPEYGDILYSKNGTIGLTRLVDWEWEFSIFVSLCLIKPKIEIIDKNYLKYYLESNMVLNQIRIRSKQGTVTNLHLEEIRDFFVTVPPLAEQKQIAEILSTVDNKLENLKEKKQSFEELKKGLMQKLLTGEVRV
ncbi:restriction endonuclease subunit S [Aliarcobacter butzleri]|uniref:restriction endonuclease subunit S n=1 Tax=Aliarcobacter butzleri TaxID=28197 RepID=UPI0021B55EAF|nr:restriction endonuclease subunit S [Aliarcobacter butzleri]MCT7649860.1 restriction endonuclease subunit S [Aliarcobacter butzleri]